MMLRQRLIHLAFFSDTNASRFTLGMAELIWAVSLFWPGDTFSRPTYTAMAELMSEEAWGALFLATGLLQFAILIRHRFHNRYAVAFAAWNTMLWWYATISTYASVYPPPAGISGELALAITASWVLVKSGYLAIPKE